MQNFRDFIMKCAIFEEHSSSCVVYSRFSGTLFPVSMIDGECTHDHACDRRNNHLIPVNQICTVGSRVFATVKSSQLITAVTHA